MKFEKYLHEENVPEWRKAYINYRQGKKYLKAIEHAVDKIETIQQEGDEAASHCGQTEEDEIRVLTLSMDNAFSSENTLAQYANSDSESDEPIMPQGRGQTTTYDAIPSSPRSRYPHSTALTIDEDRSDQTTALNPQDVPKFNRPQRRPTFAVQVGEAARTQGTHLIRSLTRRFTMANPSEHRRRTRIIRIEENSIDTVMPSLLQEEKEFFRFLDSQLEMVDKFYREKETEAAMKLKILKQQLFVADEWKRRYDERMAQAQATGGWYSAEWTKVRSGLGSLVKSNPDITPVTLGTAYQPLTDSDQTTPIGVATSAARDGSTVIHMGSESSLRQRESRQPSGDLQQRGSMDPTEYQNQLLLEDERDQRMYLNHNVAKTRIKAALYEFYRNLEMIKNYKVLNETGFAKIMKKFDKTAGWKATKAFNASKLNPRYFMSSTTLEELITETETLYIEKFEDGHRRRGMSKLRIPDIKHKASANTDSHHASVGRASFYLGLALVLLILGIQDVFSEATQIEVPYWDSLLLVYAGLFLTALFACLFGVNMYVWAKSRINYKFIFEFDARDNLDYHEFFELPLFFMLLLCLGIYLDFGSHLTNQIATAYYPMAVVGIILLIVFCPLPIASWTARKWFLLSFWRVLVSGYHGVEFRDFFLADELNSLSYSIEQAEFAVCAYAFKWNDLARNCVTSQMWITPFLTALPPWFRFLQCLRRYRDTLEWFPHLLNGGKYAASLVNLFVYFSYRHYGGDRLRYAFIGMSTFTSSVTFAWDVYMDWGLLRFGPHGGGAHGHPFLRAELVYTQPAYYYCAVVFNFFGRFAWVLRLLPLGINGAILSFCLALLEVLRRWVWNFFRLENEHLNNCGQFRAIKDIPLPFHIRVEGDTDDEEELYESEDEEGRDSEEQVVIQGQEDMEVIVADSGSGTSDQKASDTGKDLGDQDSTGSGLDQPPGLAHRRTVKRSRTQKAPRFGIERSTTFVDHAMAKAGFDDQRAQLKAASKFYDRRDFETRTIDSVEDLIRTTSRLTRAATKAARAGAGGTSVAQVQQHGMGPADTDDQGGSSEAGPSMGRRKTLGKRMLGKKAKVDEED
ncbi:hypothetical protein KVV02_001023 [Mortierella alpina]|uniref:Uncharacterized protein n=1 Tax=Mortierella alpina TaxID=64518 RepID=A0A9P8A6V1_MORAP|nr:hypothetical protein KVV02_001023 [Mortierella alpina]